MIDSPERKRKRKVPLLVLFGANANDPTLAGFWRERSATERRGSAAVPTTCWVPVD